MTFFFLRNQGVKGQVYLYFMQRTLDFLKKMEYTILYNKLFLLLESRVKAAPIQIACIWVTQ